MLLRPRKMSKIKSLAILIFGYLNFGLLQVKSEPPCNFHMSVDLTNSKKYSNGSIFLDGILYRREHTFRHSDEYRGMQLRGCPCLYKQCMRKCCPQGQKFSDSSCVESQDQEVNPFSPPIFTTQFNKTNIEAKSHFAYIYGNPCSKDRFTLSPGDFIDEYYLLENGSIYLPNQGIKMFDQMEYCLDFIKEGDDFFILPMMCFGEQEVIDEDENKIIYIINALGMGISVPFLFVTLLVYGFVPELQNLHGKALMGYVSALLLAYIFLILIQMMHFLGNGLPDKTCLAIGFIMYTCFMISFFWLNVMSFDIFWTFRVMKAARSRRSAEQRRFMFYGIYAWGMPLLLTGFLAFMQFNNHISPNLIRPSFGMKSCWLSSYTEILLYFYTPIIILVTINMILFSFTTYKILSINQETAVLRNSESGRHSNYEKEKQRLWLYVKLFLIMGVSWVAEWISFAINDSSVYIWILPDLCNALQGLFIFIIFVWKKKVKNLIVKRYNFLRYGSTVSKSRTSSRFRSVNTASTTGNSENQTEKAFLSTTDQSIRMSEFK